MLNLYYILKWATNCCDNQMLNLTNVHVYKKNDHETACECHVVPTITVFTNTLF